MGNVWGMNVLKREAGRSTLHASQACRRPIVDWLDFLGVGS